MLNYDKKTVVIICLLIFLTLSTTLCMRPPKIPPKIPRTEPRHRPQAPRALPPYHSPEFQKPLPQKVPFLEPNQKEWQKNRFQPAYLYQFLKKHDVNKNQIDEKMYQVDERLVKCVIIIILGDGGEDDAMTFRLGNILANNLAIPVITTQKILSSINKSHFNNEDYQFRDLGNGLILIEHKGYEDFFEKIFNNINTRLFVGFDDFINKSVKESFDENKFIEVLEGLLRRKAVLSTPILWTIALFGHGLPGLIAELPLGVFKNFLEFLNTKLNTRLLFYDSCYAAGANEANVFESSQDSPYWGKYYKYTIITSALKDDVTSFNSDTFDFSRFVEGIFSDPLDFKQIEGAFGMKYSSTQLRIRQPKTTWFSPVAEGGRDKNCIQIDNIQAESFKDKEFLDVGLFFKNKLYHTILLNVTDIPFSLKIESHSLNNITCMVQGDAFVYIKAIHSTNLELKNVMNAFSNEDYNSKAPQKVFFIEEVSTKSDFVRNVINFEINGRMVFGFIKKDGVIGIFRCLNKTLNTFELKKATPREASIYKYAISKAHWTKLLNLNYFNEKKFNDIDWNSREFEVVDKVFSRSKTIEELLLVIRKYSSPGKNFAILKITGLAQPATYQPQGYLRDKLHRWAHFFQKFFRHLPKLETKYNQIFINDANVNSVLIQEILHKDFFRNPPIEQAEIQQDFSQKIRSAIEAIKKTKLIAPTPQPSEFNIDKVEQST